MPRSPMRLLLGVGLASLAPGPSAGDLGAALRRAAPQQRPAAALPAEAPLSGTVVVPLRRMGARRIDGAEDGAAEATFYVGTVSVGHPAQALDVVFDTASGHVLLPHRACDSPACTEHRRFSPWESSTAMDVNANGVAVQEGQRIAQGNGTRDGVTLSYTQADLGSGDVSGVLVRDSVCLGPDACVDLAVLAATRMDSAPFRAMPGDGIVGLGLESLAATPLCSFLGRLFEGSKHVQPQFGLALSADGGELHLGGHELAPLAAPLRWLPVDHPEDGYWQVAILAVRVGDAVVHDCSKGCHGIVDTGASRLGVQESHLAALRAALTTARAPSGACLGPELTFDLGEMSLVLSAQDYADADCEVQLGALDLQEPDFTGVYALGASVLRRYYAAFDWEQRKLAFAPKAQESVLVV